MANAHAFTSGDETDDEMETLVTGNETDDKMETLVTNDEDPLVTEICSWFWDRQPKAKDRGASLDKCKEIEKKLRELRELRHIGPRLNYPEFYDVWGTVFKWLSNERTVPVKLTNAMKLLESNILRKKDFYFKKDGERRKDIKVISPYNYRLVWSLKHATVKDSAIEARFNVDKNDDNDKMVSLRLSDKEKNALEEAELTLCVPDVPVWFKATKTFLEAIEGVYEFFYDLDREPRKDVEPYLRTRRKTRTTAQSKPAATPAEVSPTPAPTPAATETTEVEPEPALSRHQLQERIKETERALAKSKRTPEPESEPEPQPQPPKELKVGDLYGGGDNKRYWVRINAIENDIVHFSDPNWKCSIKSVLLRNDRVMRVWDFKVKYKWKCTPEIKEVQRTRPKPQPKAQPIPEPIKYTDGTFTFYVKVNDNLDTLFYPCWNDEDNYDLKLGYELEDIAYMNQPIRFKEIKRNEDDNNSFEIVDGDLKIVFVKLLLQSATFNDDNVDCFLERYERYQLPEGYELPNGDEICKGISGAFAENLMWLDEFRQTMKRYGGSETADKIAFGILRGTIDVAKYHTFTLEEMLEEIEDDEFYEKFNAWSLQKKAMAAKKHARDIRKLFQRASTPAFATSYASK